MYMYFILQLCFAVHVNVCLVYSKLILKWFMCLMKHVIMKQNQGMRGCIPVGIQYTYMCTFLTAANTVEPLLRPSKLKTPPLYGRPLTVPNGRLLKHALV